MRNEENYRKFFKPFQAVLPKKDLLERVLFMIRNEEYREAKRRLVGYLSVSVISFLSLIPSAIYLYAAIIQSGFLSFLSLLITDSAAIKSFFGDYLYTLGESMPILELIVFLGIFFIFMEALRFAAKQLPNVNIREVAF